MHLHKPLVCTSISLCMIQAEDAEDEMPETPAVPSPTPTKVKPGKKPAIPMGFASFNKSKPPAPHEEPRSNAVRCMPKTIQSPQKKQQLATRSKFTAINPGSPLRFRSKEKDYTKRTALGMNETGELVMLTAWSKSIPR